jgi:cobalamin biosynthesis protein CobD/CbiB
MFISRHVKATVRRDMNKKNKIILKAAAIVMILIGLLAMLMAWNLLLVGSIHTSTVLVLEMGGVVVCLAGYFLRRHVNRLEKEAKRQIPAVQFAAEEDPHE